MGFSKVFGQARGLLAEKQPAAVPELRRRIGVGRFRGGEPDIPGVWVPTKKVVQILVIEDLHQMPVIQSRPFDGPFRDIKPQGTD